MVNNNFYKTINNLVSQGTTGVAPEIVDYKTFIDSGRTLMELSGSDLQNNFIKNLMNKIALTLNTARAYKGKYSELVRGSLEFGNTIELIMNKFYESQAAAFVELKNGESVDQYVINKPEAFADYFIDTNAYTIPITIQLTELKKAWDSPAAMDSFIQSTMLYVMNSNEKNKESGRIALVAKVITDLNEVPGTDDDNKPGMVYPMLTIFNKKMGTKLTSENCIYNGEFVKFFVATVKKVMKKISDVSDSYNIKGIKTFTPAEGRHIFLNSAVAGSMDTYIRTDNYHPEYSVLTDYIEVPYWQNQDKPFTVDYKTKGGETATSAPIGCVIVDKFAVGEYLKKQNMNTTPFNARGEYWNNFLNVETMYVQNKYANTVIFTLN